LLTAAELSGRKLGIDPLLIVAVMANESSFNPIAESNMGAQGLMQVIPRFHLDKIGRNAGEDALFDPALNIRVGTMVLVEGMQSFGSLHNALQYNCG
ncbi:transglycosylase SLT domain-containing protein, partial [Aromatoleum toluclasticum]|uniref:transglycosylase SLT domain-containing protein n=1 Tax=Aromatoleum toluclasticum TaxID=92003 RepID=UPI001D18477D